MEPRRVFAETLHVIRKTQVQEPDKRYRGIVEFEDGDQYRFMTEEEIKEGSWCTAIGTFEEEHGGPLVLIEEVRDRQDPNK